MARRYVRRNLFPDEVFRNEQNTFFTEMCDGWDEVAQEAVDDNINAIPLLIENYPFDFISVADEGYETYEGEFCEVDQFGNTELLTNADQVVFDQNTTVMLNNRLGFKFFNSTLFDTDDYREIYANLGYFYWENGTERFVDFFAYALDSFFVMETLWAYYNPNNETKYEDPTNILHPIMLPESHPDIQAELALGLFGNTVYNRTKDLWDEGTIYPTSHVDLFYDLLRFPDQSLADLYKFFNYVAPQHLVLRNIVKQVELDPTPFLMTGEVERVVEWVLS